MEIVLLQSFVLSAEGLRVLYAAKVVDASFIGGQHSFVTLSLSFSLSLLRL